MKLNCIRVVGLLLILSGIAIVLFGTVTLLTKPHYRVVATVQLDPSVRYDEEPTGIETEIIQSTNVLDRVIEQLQLKSKWVAPRNGEKQLDEEDVLKMLRERIAFRRFPETMTIEIRVTDTEPVAATELANAIVAAYEEHLYFVSLELASFAGEALVKRCREVEAKMNAAKQTMERLKVELKVPDPEPADLATAYLRYYQEKQRYEELKHFLNLTSMKLNSGWHPQPPKLGIHHSLVPPVSIFPDPSLSGWICCTGVMMIGYGSYRTRLKS
jgi:uncharacterized protein involved in exopolysaccharide biosynthesis